MSPTVCTRAPFVKELIKAIPRRAYTTHQSALLRRQAFRAPVLRPQPSIQQCRHAGLFTGNIKSNIRKLYRQSPVVTSVSLVLVFVSFGGLLYLPYGYYKAFAFHDYPEPVAVELRNALSARLGGDLIRSVRHYQRAVKQAEELQMDMWTDDIFGIKLRIVEVMEQAGRYEKAVEALEYIRKLNLEAMKDLKDDPARKKTVTLLLTQAVAASVKLGALYSRPEVWHREAAEKHLSWAFETQIAELQRRQRLKVTEEQEGPWVTFEQISKTAENLAQEYQEKDQNYLASPLYLHAINLQQKKDCHTVIMMNNLASSLAQQSPRAATVVQNTVDSNTVNNGAPTVPVSRAMLLQMGQAWAQNALNLAGTIAPPERTEDCDTGCAVALHNLGEIAEMLKDVEGAKKQYREAISLARAIGFREGIAASSARLQALEKQG